MVALLVILFVICIMGGGAKIYKFNENYISPKYTNAIKGVFALIILFSHMRGYITLSNNFYDQWFCGILDFIGQLMVAPYLFYSGFGIMESLKNKPYYMQAYPKKRILKTLINFDLAVLLYVITMSLIKVYYPTSYYFTCWIGWDSVGNSNWFIFDILMLYVMFFICYHVYKYIIPKHIPDRKRQFAMLLLFTIMTIILWTGLYMANKGCRWIDTLITCPMGAWFSYFRLQIEGIMKKTYISDLLLLLLAVAFVIWKIHFGNDKIGIAACLFCLLLVLICTKVEIDNKYLQWLGTHAFSIYIIQRLPMNLFSYYGFDDNAYRFALISIPSVLITAYIYNQVLARIHQ